MKENLDYALGLVIGSNLRGLGVEKIDSAAFLSGVEDLLLGRTPAVDVATAQRRVAAFLQEQEARRSEGLRAEGEAFLKQNAGKQGIVVTKSGLQYEVLSEGTGASPRATDTVRCHYEGRLVDGSVFDSSYRRGEPAEFPLNGVIAGWTEGLQLMKEGAKYRFYIPQELGYGARGAGSSIPPYAALIFDVELIKVK
ncbi:MAG: FKBP-type peptidyl-prolyl cis-trans isomerase [Alloprevotella sp.]|nr:FKBP-type peptidyl-prolyl cis-trans isomerase [Alloprevotella sp.]